MCLCPDTVDIPQTHVSPSLRKSCVSQVLVCAGGSRPPLHPLPPAASLLSLALVTAASSVVLLDPPKVQASSLIGRRYEVTPGLWPLTLGPYSFFSSFLPCSLSFPNFVPTSDYPSDM